MSRYSLTQFNRTSNLPLSVSSPWCCWCRRQEFRVGVRSYICALPHNSGGSASLLLHTQVRPWLPTAELLVPALAAQQFFFVVHWGAGRTWRARGLATYAGRHLALPRLGTRKPTTDRQPTPQFTQRTGMSLVWTVARRTMPARSSHVVGL